MTSPSGSAAADGLRGRLHGRLGAFSLDAAVEAPAGAITSVFGPSGSGKTTLLRAVSGLLRLSGALRFGAETWQDDETRLFRRPHRRPVGFVFQQPALFPHLPVAGNLRYAERRAPPGRRRFAFPEIVERLDLAALLDRPPADLSGGEKQRAALGRSLLSGPEALLLDEPFSALDRASRARILPFLRSLAREEGLCLLHVSHDPAEVVRLADRLVLLSGGRVVESGPAAALFGRLDDEEAAAGGEAGATLTARVVDLRASRGLVEVELAGQPVFLPSLPGAAPPPPGGTVRLRLPAREVALATRRPEAISVRNILAGRVLGLRREADAPLVEVTVGLDGGEPARLRARITADAADDLGLEPGTPVFALLRSVSLLDP